MATYSGNKGSSKSKLTAAQIKTHLEAAQDELAQRIKEHQADPTPETLAAVHALQQRVQGLQHVASTFQPASSNTPVSPSDPNWSNFNLTTGLGTPKTGDPVDTGGGGDGGNPVPNPFPNGLTIPPNQYNTPSATPDNPFPNGLTIGQNQYNTPGAATGDTTGASAAFPNGLTIPPNQYNTPGATSTSNPSGLDFSSAQAIIDSALQIVGLDPNSVASSGVNSGSTLAQYFWSQIVNQGLTDPTTIGEMISTLLPATGQFQVAFPGYAQALSNGYVRNVAQYVAAEEGMTGVMLQGGVPKDMITPTTIGNLISNGLSVNEVATRVQNGLDAALNAPAEVQNYFAQQFGAGSGTQALATVFLNPNIDDVTLNKMLAGAQIRGAAAASNLTISQGLSQRLADQGQTYASAQAKFQGLTAQAGLFQQTVGEQSSQAPVPGTQNQNQPLTESNQGVMAAFGESANAMQQVHQASLARQQEFRGGGGASTSQQEGYSGLANAKPF